MGHIAWQAEQGQHAVDLWSEAFAIARETQNAQLLFHTANTLGQVFASSGAPDRARQLLQLAVEVGTAAGFPEVQQAEAVLRRLPPAQA